MTPGVQNIILPLSVPLPYGLIQNTSPFFVCLSYLQYITKSMQGNCFWAKHTKQSAFAVK